MFLVDSPRYRLGAWMGIPIYVQQTFLFILGFIVLMGSMSGWAGTFNGLLFGVVLGFSILVHEFGHALMVKRLGHGSSTVMLHGLGGVCMWRGTQKRRDRILIALGGPMAGLALGFLVLAVWSFMPSGLNRWVVTVFNHLLLVNILWSVFNLLPILPMDGGHVLEWAYARRPHAPRNAMRTVILVSMVTAGLTAVAGLVMGEMFVVVLLGFILYMNWQMLQKHPRVGPPRGGGGGRQPRAQGGQKGKTYYFPN